MITRTAHLDSKTAQAADRASWRMDPPPPKGLDDLLQGALPGAVVALLLLVLLLAFSSVVRDGVRRGEQLRNQPAQVTGPCDALLAQSQALGCTDSVKPAPQRRAQRPAASETAVAGLLTLQR